MAHTPGKWVQGNNHPDEVFSGDDYIRIADCHNNSRPEDVQIANARLIAAAPELLEACKLAFDYYRSIGSGKYNPYEVEQSLEKAIAKATGAQ